MLSAIATSYISQSFESFVPERITVPYDLSDYARAQTGPSSWAARSDAPLGEQTDAILGIWPSDVPCLAPVANDDVPVLVDDREALVLSSIDGQADVGTIMALVDLPGAEALDVLCALCARGLLTLDRAGRPRSSIVP